MGRSLSIGGIFIHPVKSLSPISLDTSEITLRGLRNDRRWMMIDDNNRFISQRSHPKVRLCNIRQSESGFEISTPDNSSAEIPAELLDGESISTRMFDDQAILVSPFGGDANLVMSKYLGEDIRFCYQRDEHIRPSDPEYSLEGDNFSLADGFPILVTNQASLDDLNSRMTRALPMSRFRPNLVVEGDLIAWEEDHWSYLKNGTVSLRIVKACARCAVVTVSDEGKFQKEPLHTLNSFRNWGGKVLFGMNIIPDHSGRISVGDDLRIETNTTNG